MGSKIPSHSFADVCRMHLAEQEQLAAQNSDDDSSRISADGITAMLDHVAGLPADSPALAPLNHVGLTDPPDLKTDRGRTALINLGEIAPSLVSDKRTGPGPGAAGGGGPEPVWLQLEYVIAEEIRGLIGIASTKTKDELIKEANREQDPLLGLVSLSAARKIVDREFDEAEREKVTAAAEAGVPSFVLGWASGSTYNKIERKHPRILRDQTW